MFSTMRRGFFKRNKKPEKMSPRQPRINAYKKIAWTFLGGTSLLMWTNFYKTKVEVKYTPTDFNQIAVAHIPELRKPYTTTYYLPFRLWEMVMGARIERPPYVKTFDSVLQLDDGDQLELGKILFQTLVLIR
jgi:hypothetical protein